MSTDGPLEAEFLWKEDAGEFGYWAGDGEEDSYPTDSEQAWNIVPESGAMYIVINFTVFKTEPQYDVVRVFPCLDDSCAGCAVTMSGLDTQCPVLITTGQARVTFSSDESFGYQVRRCDLYCAQLLREAFLTVLNYAIEANCLAGS